MNNKRIRVHMVRNCNDMKVYKKKSTFHSLEITTVINYLDIFIEILY